MKIVYNPKTQAEIRAYNDRIDKIRNAMSDNGEDFNEEDFNKEMAAEAFISCPLCQNEISTDELIAQEAFRKNSTKLIEPIGKISKKIAFKECTGDTIHCPHCEGEFMNDEKTVIKPGILPIVSAIAASAMLLLFVIITGIIGISTTISANHRMEQVAYAIEHRLDTAPVEEVSADPGDAVEPMSANSPLRNVMGYGLAFTGILMVITGMMKVMKSLVGNGYESPVAAGGAFLVGIFITGISAAVLHPDLFSTFFNFSI